MVPIQLQSPLIHQKIFKLADTETTQKSLKNYRILARNFHAKPLCPFGPDHANVEKSDANCQTRFGFCLEGWIGVFPDRSRIRGAIWARRTKMLKTLQRFELEKVVECGFLTFFRPIMSCQPRLLCSKVRKPRFQLQYCKNPNRHRVDTF